MPIDFPTSPTLNQTYSYNSRTWKWDGQGWKVDQPSITFTDITTALGYTPLSSNGGTISGNLQITGSANSVSFITGSLSANAFTLNGNLSGNNNILTTNKAMALTLVFG